MLTMKMLRNSLVTRVMAAANTLLFAILIACEKKEPEAPVEPPLFVGNDSEPVNPEIKIGVESCDRLLEKYRRCLAKLPESTRQSMQVGLTKAEQTWIKTSKQPNSEAKLTSACKKMDESLSQVMKAQGCQWD